MRKIFSPTIPERTENSKYMERLEKFGTDNIVGIGGGSTLDIAKTASILITNTEPVNSFFLYGEVFFLTNPLMDVPNLRFLSGTRI